jgi:hypothetical protein
MRFTSPGAAAGRQQRLERLRRDRAAAKPLRALFPAVEQVRIDLKFEGESSASSAPASQSHVLHPPARAFFEFPCPYADCDGQFNLTSAVEATLTSSVRQVQGVLECAGLRARSHSPKHPCQLHLNYTVTANYEPDA